MAQFLPILDNVFGCIMLCYPHIFLMSFACVEIKSIQRLPDFYILQWNSIAYSELFTFLTLLENINYRYRARLAGLHAELPVFFILHNASLIEEGFNSVHQAVGLTVCWCAFIVNGYILILLFLFYLILPSWLFSSLSSVLAVIWLNWHVSL